MLSVCYEGIAIPLFWQLLKKSGSTQGSEQIALLNRFIKVFGKGRIEAVLADREFPNQALIGWLNARSIPFYMRVKHNTRVSIQGKPFKTAGQLFARLTPYQQQVFNLRVQVFGQMLYLAASKNECNALMIIATNAQPKKAVAIYLRRWEIESLFQALKKRGFRFEDTHVTKHERIERIIAFLAVAFAWAHKAGEWRAIKKAIPLKKIQQQRRPQYSFFRYGLDYLRDCFTLNAFKMNELRKLIMQLVPYNDMGDEL